MTRRFDILLTDDAPLQHDPWCWRDDWHADGESAFALLAKFQRLNALSCKALVESFACREGRRAAPQDLDLRDARRFDLHRLMGVLRLRLVDVAAAFVMPSGTLQRIASPTLRWCVRCARAGVHLTVFQYHRLEQCPVHRMPLSEHCGRCGAAIPYRLRADLFRAPFNCPACAHPWWEPAGGVDDLRVRRPGRWRPDGCAQITLLPAASFVAPAHFIFGAAGAMEADVVTGMANSLQAAALPWITFGMNAAAEPDNVWLGGALTDWRPCDSDGQARSCYKAVQRRLMKTCAREHRACIRTAARHLAWPITGCTTASFCPVAQAFLRWRCKWEGVGTPRSLLQRRFHGPLGLAIWLSLDAPVAPPTWNREAGRWLTLHCLVQACLDSFRTYLAEARGAGEHRRTLWLPFPVHDFPRCTIFVRGGRYRHDPVGVQVLPACERQDKSGTPNPNSAVGHSRAHLLQLSRNVQPA